MKRCSYSDGEKEGRKARTELAAVAQHKRSLKREDGRGRKIEREGACREDFYLNWASSSDVCNLTSGPMCSVCVVRSVIWQSFIFRAVLALSCIQNKHNQPCPKEKKEHQTHKLEQLNVLPADLRLDSTCNTKPNLQFLNNLNEH